MFIAQFTPIFHQNCVGAMLNTHSNHNLDIGIKYDIVDITDYSLFTIEPISFNFENWNILCHRVGDLTCLVRPLSLKTRKKWWNYWNQSSKLSTILMMEVVKLGSGYQKSLTCMPSGPVHVSGGDYNSKNDSWRE
jgi:hypothetical protein